MTTLNEREKIIISMMLNNPDCTSREIMSTLNRISEVYKLDIFQLFTATNKQGANFIKITDYNSTQSDNTEVADHTVNIGISYANMSNKDSLTLNDLQIDTICEVLQSNVMNHNYSKYDLSKFHNPEKPYLEIFDILPATLIEMKQDDQKPADRINNNIKLNPVLWFNTNTENLLIFGKSVSKNTKVMGEFKKVKSAPKTVAKNIIREILRKDDLRTFAISNVITKVAGNKETVEMCELS